MDELFDPQGNRVFLALFPDEKALKILRDIVRGFKKEARNLKFVSLEQMHVTFQFLGGSVSTKSINAIVEDLELSINNIPSPKVVFDGVSYGFPGQRIPSAIYWNIDNTSELRNFTRAVFERIKNLDLPDIVSQKDHAKLIHHLTLGRVKNSASKSLARNIKKIIADLDVEEYVLEAKYIAVVKSVLTNTGPRYQLLKKIYIKK